MSRWSSCIWEGGCGFPIPVIDPADDDNLWWRAFRTIATPQRAIGFALAVTIGYAATDEFHQTFIGGRHGSPIDVAIDSVGAGIAAIAVHRRSR